MSSHQWAVPYAGRFYVTHFNPPNHFSWCTTAVVEWISQHQTSTKWLLCSLFWTQSMVRPYGFVVFDNEPPNWCCSFSFHMMCYNSETANLTKNNNNELLVAQSLLKTSYGGNIWRYSIWQWTIKIGVIQLHERPSLECNRLTSVGCSSLSNITSLYVLTFIMHAKFICIW